MFALRTARSSAAIGPGRPVADLDRHAAGCVTRGVASGLRDVLPLPDGEALPTRFDPLIRRLLSGPLGPFRASSRRKVA
ncbi:MULTISPECIES: hypothetical protein [Methylobacterium]|uniref:hypothetical protein n=1 Tax=Methylobacterium TaxID=407 RepID=UPI001043AE70|nr:MULTISPECIES: hypothetical protein [Methylobacterium]MDR7036144.1 hypothetical protein [Methylobacterium sp. BE186]